MHVTNKNFRVFKLCCVLLALIVIQGCASTSDSSGATKPAANVYINYKDADQDYQKLVLVLKNEQATPLAFDNIIKVYPLTTNYDPYTGIEQAQKLVANNSMDTQNWRLCLQATSAILNENFTSLTGHYGAMVCHLESGNTTQGEFHKRMLNGFVSAVIRSGKGTSPQSAFYVTSANDLYAFIQLQNHIAVGQSLVYQDKRPIHAMTVRNQTTKKESVWYFDVTAQFRRGVIDSLN